MSLPKDGPFDIKLSSGRESRPYGLVIERGSLQVSAVSQDDSVYIRNVGKKVGDFDEQRSWKGGRGHEKYNDNNEGYWDGSAWTMTKGHVHNNLLWRFAKGLRKATSNFSDSKSWRTLAGATRGISISFTPDETGAYKTMMIWVRRRGSSAASSFANSPLTITLHQDSAGSPGTAIQIKQTYTDTPGDFASKLAIVDFTGTETLTNGTTYHISVAGDTTSNDAGHWEVAVDASGTGSKVSSDLSSWTAPGSSFSLLYRITDTDVDRRFLPFIFGAGLGFTFYVVDIKDDGTTASQLYINGDRGNATGGTTTTLVDTTFGCRASAWPDNVLAGAKIQFKKNNEWYYATIASHTGGTYTFEEATAAAPAAGNNYIVYSTPWFTELTVTGLGVVTGEPAVLSGTVYFPQGTGTAIRRMTLDYGQTQNHVYASEATAGSEYANFLLSSHDKTDGAIIWRGLNSTVTVSYAKAVAWGNNLTFGTAIPCGDTSYTITGLNEKEGLQVFKEDGPGTVIGNTYISLKSGQEDTPDTNNGIASVVVDKFMYYSWLHSVVRVYGSSYDDIGQDFSGFGLPAGREGNFAYLDAYITTVLGAVDARDGTSSVLIWDGLGWHELLRGYYPGKRIRMVKTQPCSMARNIIWTNVGGELVYQEMPLRKKDPLFDSGALYQHESVVESSIIDMGTASNLPKFIKELTATVKNLNSEGMEVYLDYQVDSDCHTSTWTPSSVLTQSPESTAFLGLSNIRRFAYRLRLCTDDATTPVDIEGVVPTGYARTPLKLMWSMRVKAGGVYQVASQTNYNAQKLWKWLMDNCRYPYAVLMESKYDAADGYHVVIHPPRMTPYKPAEPGQPEEAYLTVVFEEV
jgi:hypothetical protein